MSNPLENMIEAFTGAARLPDGEGYHRAVNRTQAIDTVPLEKLSDKPSLMTMFSTKQEAGPSQSGQNPATMPTAKATQSAADKISGIDNLQGHSAAVAGADRAGNTQNAQLAKADMQSHVAQNMQQQQQQPGQGDPEAGGTNLAEVAVGTVIGAGVTAAVGAFAPAAAPVVAAVMTAKTAIDVTKGASYFQPVSTEDRKGGPVKSEPDAGGYSFSAQSQEMMTAMSQGPGFGAAPVSMMDVENAQLSLMGQQGLNIPYQETPEYKEMSANLAKMDNVISQDHTAQRDVTLGDALEKGEMRLEQVNDPQYTANMAMGAAAPAA